MSIAAWEFEKIKTIAAGYGVDPAFVLAIRQAENGGPGREFGVLSVPAPTWEDQCRICCATVRNHLLGASDVPYKLTLGAGGIKRVSYSDTFIGTFQRTWAPTKATNDPHHLNANWAANVTKLYHDVIDDLSLEASKAIENKVV